jgi:hypothetical protein
MTARRRPARRARAQDPDGRRRLAELWASPDYLAFKEELGMPLADSERAILEAARARALPEPVDGGGAT